MDNDNLKTIRIKEKCRYNDDLDFYTFQLKHTSHKRWWWLLLLLIPLLLFIKCDKDITVHCVEPQANIAVVDQPISINYQAHYLWGNGGFLSTDTINITQKTDSLGNTVFKDLPCSVFSYVFYCLTEANFTATSDCYSLQDASCNFHYTSSVELTMEPRLENLNIQLRDKETGDVLPDGILVYSLIDDGKEITDSVIADANGIAKLPKVNCCSVLRQIIAKCYGYADSVAVDVPCQDLVNATDSNAINLKPIKKRFTFFVKDANTREPIPDALCDVSLTYPGDSKTIVKRQIKTSIDGKGLAAYDSAFVLSTIDITARKINYKSGKLESGPWTVEKFIKQEDEVRTIYLEATLFNQELINVDSISGVPVPGVKNNITLISPDGSKTEYVETSNRNGKFFVSANGPEQVYINSELYPGYVNKQTYIKSFENIEEKERKVLMKPLMDTLVFRTLCVDKNNTLLPSCMLEIYGSLSGWLNPSNSGNGEFEVIMRKAENLNIQASKGGYISNSNKIKNRSWGYLSADQEHRDIPLMLDIPPCSGGVNTPKGLNEQYHKCSYAMGQPNGEASISGDFFCEPDLLTVYDGPDTSSPVLIGPDVNIADTFKKKFHFNNGIVTVTIKTSTNHGSTWEYILHCPDK